MPDAELLKRFQACLRYRQARSWRKPLLNPRRFLANQFHKYSQALRQPGSLRTVRAFHFNPFTIAEGELVSQHLSSYGLIEPELTEAFLRLVHPGEIVLDIGMHLGYYATLFAVLVGPRGQVHAFEPTPSTREIGLRNTSLFPQIQVHPLALWSESGTVVLHDYGLKWMGFNSLRRAKLEEAPAPPNEIKVQSITLDQFRSSLDPGKKVALVKIDAELAEREILSGAKELIAKDRPLISAEVGDEKDSDQSRRLIEDFKSLNYVPWEFRDGRFIRHQALANYSYDNLIFAPSTADLNEIA